MSVSLAVGDVRRIAHGPTRTLFVGLLLKSIGSGLTLSLITVYLEEVRDFPVLVATLLLAWQALLTLAVSPVVGTLVDRRGPRPVLLAALLHRGRQHARVRAGHDVAAGVRRDVGHGRRRGRHLGADRRAPCPPGALARTDPRHSASSSCC